MKLTKVFVIFSLLLCLCTFSSSAACGGTGWSSQITITCYYAGSGYPGGDAIVFTGICNGTSYTYYFNISTTSQLSKAMAALVMSAYTNGTTVAVYVDGSSGGKWHINNIGTPQ